MKFGKLEKPEFVREDSRGVFKEHITFGEWRSVASGNMKSKSEMGHHYHSYTVVLLLLLKGSAQVKTFNIKTQERKTEILDSGQAYLFKPEEVRVIHYLTESDFILLKSHVYNPSAPDLIEHRLDH